MILKSLAIKSKRQLYNTLLYILHGQEQDQDAFVLTKYIRADRRYRDILQEQAGDVALENLVIQKRAENMFQQIIANNELRQIPHKRANIMTHEIVSYHEKDAEKLPKKALVRASKEFIRLRCPDSIVVCVNHMEKNRHLHFLVSTVTYGDGLVHRLSKKEFSNVKEQFQEFERKELGLEHSIKVAHVKKKTMR